MGSRHGGCGCEFTGAYADGSHLREESLGGQGIRDSHPVVEMLAFEKIAGVVIHSESRGAPLMTAGDDLPPQPRRNETAMTTMLKVFFVFLAPVGPQPVLRILGDSPCPRS